MVHTKTGLTTSGQPIDTTIPNEMGTLKQAQTDVKNGAKNVRIYKMSKTDNNRGSSH